jgi:hypothetical protein
VYGLGALMDVRAIGPLNAILGDEDKNVAFQASQAIIGFEDAALLSLFSAFKDPGKHVYATTALEKIG